MRELDIIRQALRALHHALKDSEGKPVAVKREDAVLALSVTKLLETLG